MGIGDWGLGIGDKWNFLNVKNAQIDSKILLNV